MRKIIILLSVFFLLLSIPGCKKKLLITFTFANINSWQELFTDPVEKVLVFVEDKNSPGDKVIFRFQSFDERAVYLRVGEMEEDLKKHDYKIEDIEIIIHNHFVKCKFSESDKGQYRALKRRGFNGLFLLYCQRTKEVYDIEEKK